MKFSREIKRILSDYLIAKTKYKKNKVPLFLKILFTVFGWLLSFALIFFSPFTAQYINFYSEDTAVFSSALEIIEDRPSVSKFTVLLFFVLFFIIMMLVKKLWIADAIIGIGTFAISLSSYLKHCVTDEYLYPWDFQQTGNINLLKEYINTKIPTEFFIILGIICAVVVITAFSKAELNIRWHFRIPAAVILSAFLFLSYSKPSNASSLLSDYDMTFSNQSIQSVNYNHNGFVGAFMINLLSNAITEPQNYSRDTTEAIVAEYEEKDADETFEYPNVILILQESFWDVRNLPKVTFSDNPLKNFDEIIQRNNAYSGKFTTTSFGGGTVIPEFEVLSGLTASILPSGSVPYQYITSPFECYPSMFKELGYDTLAIHPYLSNFYMRESKYPLLGFDATYFYDDLTDIEDVIPYTRGKSISDDVFVKYIEYFLEKNSSPSFIFGISMEGHQPYPGKYEDYDIKISCDAFDEELTEVVNQYTQYIYYADRAIKNLTDYVDSTDEKTVLVLFGDHAPTLGSEKAAFIKSGMISGGEFTREEADKFFTTPFLIYSNFDLTENEMINKSSGNIVASYNLMNCAVQMINGPETKLMGFLTDYALTAPGYNRRMRMDKTEEISLFEENHKILTYDRIKGKNYSK